MPWDDALVYVLDEEGNAEYRIYDLNAVNYFKPYAPENMEYLGEYYAGEGAAVDVGYEMTVTTNPGTGQKLLRGVVMPEHLEMVFNIFLKNRKNL